MMRELFVQIEDLEMFWQQNNWNGNIYSVLKKSQAILMQSNNLEYQACVSYLIHMQW